MQAVSHCSQSLGVQHILLSCVRIASSSAASIQTEHSCVHDAAACCGELKKSAIRAWD